MCRSFNWGSKIKNKPFMGWILPFSKYVQRWQWVEKHYTPCTLRWHLGRISAQRLNTKLKCHQDYIILSFGYRKECMLFLFGLKFGPSTGKTCWRGSTGRTQKRSEGWNTSPVSAGWESWGCSAWRREGSKETLLLPSSTWRGLQESWRGTFDKGM